MNDHAKATKSPDIDSILTRQGAAFWRLGRSAFVVSVLLLRNPESWALDCDPKADCAPKGTCTLKEDSRICNSESASPCVLQVDTRDCNPHWSCESNCPWFDVGCAGRKAACEANKAAFRTACEAAKAAQNAAYASARTSCQAAFDKNVQAGDAAKTRAACEEAKAAQNALYAAAYTQCQKQLDVDRVICEETRDRQRRECEQGLRGPFSCSAAETMQRLSTKPEAYIDKTHQRVGWLTSGVTTTEGWLATACNAKGVGVPYHEAVLSSDGFWTIDVRLEAFSIGDVSKPSGNRYVRLVLRPLTLGGGKAHELADNHYITVRDVLAFSGPIVIERAPSASLEVHVVDDLELLPRK